MDEREYRELLERTALGTSAARRLRELTSREDAETTRLLATRFRNHEVTADRDRDVRPDLAAGTNAAAIAAATGGAYSTPKPAYEPQFTGEVGPHRVGPPAQTLVEPADGLAGQGLEGWVADDGRLTRLLRLDDSEHAALAEQIRIFSDTFNVHPAVSRSEETTIIVLTYSEELNLTIVTFAGRIESAFIAIAGPPEGSPHLSKGRFSRWRRRNQ